VLARLGVVLLLLFEVLGLGMIPRREAGLIFAPVACAGKAAA